MQLNKVLAVVTLCAAVSGAVAQVTCRLRSQCAVPYRRVSGRPVFCDVRNDIILCQTGGRVAARRQPAVTTTIPATTVTTVTATQPTSSAAPAVQVPSDVGQGPHHLQHLQGSANLGTRFGSQLQGQVDQLVQGLQALSASRASGAFQPAPVGRSGSFLRGL